MRPLVAEAGPTEEKAARSFGAPGSNWSSDSKEAPTATPFFVLAGAPVVFLSGIPSALLSVLLLPAEMKTIASPWSKRNWSTSIALAS